MKSLKLNEILEMNPYGKIIYKNLPSLTTFLEFMYLDLIWLLIMDPIL